MERTEMIMEKYVYEDDINKKLRKNHKWFKKRGLAFLTVVMLRTSKVTDKIENARHTLAVSVGDWEKYPVLMQLIMAVYMSSAMREHIVDKMNNDGVFRLIVEEDIKDYNKMASGNGN